MIKGRQDGNEGVVIPWTPIKEVGFSYSLFGGWEQEVLYKEGKWTVQRYEKRRASSC